MEVLQQAGIKLGDAAAQTSLTVKLKDVKEIFASAAARPKSLAMVIEAFGRVIRDSGKTSKGGAALPPPPLIVIDEANKLERWDPGSPEALRTLLDFFVLVTKQDNVAHVILATSDTFLPAWLEKNGINPAFFNIVTVGNLPESEARSVFKLLLEETATAPPLEEEDWVAVYRVCGGNVGILSACAIEACLLGSWAQAVCDVADTACADLQRGLSPQRAAWTADEYAAVVRIIAESEHGAVPREAFVEKFGNDRSDVILPALLSANRLGLRQRSCLALDLPAELFVGRQPLYVLPTAAHLQQARTLDEFKSAPELILPP